jgi:uncharacterized membrane protein
MPNMTSAPEAHRLTAAPGDHPDDTASPRLRRWQAVAIGSTLALIVLGLCWELWWAPTGTGRLALKVLPLLLPLPGLWRHRLYTYRWLSLLVWMYFAEGVVRATSDTGLSAGLAAVEAALGLLLFSACAVYVRLRLRGAPLPATGTSSNPGDDKETRR